MIVPLPATVDEIMSHVVKGKLLTTDIIRKALAARHKTATACPVSTSMAIITAAFASEERVSEGKGKPTPYWRTLKSGGELNDKYPRGIEGQKTMLEAEGHVVSRRGKKFFVENYEASLADL